MSLPTEKMLSKAKCPKCKSDNLFLIEIWKDHYIQWEQIDGIFNKNDGTSGPGHPYKVEAKCSQCKYSWTVKNAHQIGDVILTKTE
jgi:phage FluMu protein Com